MSRLYAKRRCLRCCPEGGAICDRTFDVDRKPVWECRNCGHVEPRRVVKPARDVTPRQRAVVQQFERAGYKLERQERIGDKLFVVLINGAGFMEFRFIGTIGRRGAIDLTLYRFGGQRKFSDLALALRQL